MTFNGVMEEKTSQRVGECTRLKDLHHLINLQFSIGNARISTFQLQPTNEP